MKLILFLIAGFSYLASVFELDKDEFKENFEKEQCAKVCCAKITDSKASFQIISPKPAILVSVTYELPLTSAIINAETIFPPAFNPPEKIFIQHRALLI